MKDHRSDAMLITFNSLSLHFTAAGLFRLVFGGLPPGNSKTEARTWPSLASIVRAKRRSRLTILLPRPSSYPSCSDSPQAAFDPLAAYPPKPINSLRSLLYWMYGGVEMASASLHALCMTKSSEPHETPDKTGSDTDNGGLHSYSDLPLTKRCPDPFAPLTAPSNFGTVVSGEIFRGSFPLPENFSFLKALKLKTILTLVSEPFPPEYVEFMVANGIRQEVIYLPPNKQSVQIEATAMIKALGVILDRANHPILIHCNKGKHRTGCVVACLRKIQGETLDGILTEYHNYADPKARILDEVFIKEFDDRALLWMAAENGFLPADQPGSQSPALPLVSRTRM